MSNLLIGFIFGLGFGGWVYSKLIRSTGGNTQNALIVSVIAGAIAMVIVTFLFGAFVPDAA